jgi:hypothetical protein
MKIWMKKRSEWFNSRNKNEDMNQDLSSVCPLCSISSNLLNDRQVSSNEEKKTKEFDVKVSKDKKLNLLVNTSAPSFEHSTRLRTCLPKIQLKHQ